MAYERTGLGTEEVIGIQAGGTCPQGYRVGQSPDGSICVRSTATAGCPTGQTRAFSTQPCKPVCSTYRCPTGQTKVAQTGSRAGAAGPIFLAAQRTIEARGCTVAPCSDGPQLIDSSARITYCCPPQAATTATPATPPPPTIVYSTPQVQQTVSHGYGPLFWIGLGCVGVGLVLVLKK